MKGLVYDGEKAVLRDDLEVRSPGPTEVKVRVAACGLCHSDLSVIDGTIPWPTPVVLGHEGAGIVEEVGAAVRNVAPGDHVVLHILTNCGTCKWCSIGKPVRCRATMANADQPFLLDGEPVWNFSGASFLAEHTLVGATQCVKIGDDIDLDVACLVGCAVLTGIGSVWNRTSLGLGDTCAVFGAGGVGLNVIQGARIKGASRIVAIDTNPAKEEIARTFGATDFLVTAPGDDVVTRVRELLPYDATTVVGPFGAGGVDYAFDCVGHPSILNAAIDMLEWGGTAVAVGVPAGGATVPLRVWDVEFVERHVTGSRTGSYRPGYDIPLILDLYRRGVVKLDELVTARYSLDRWEAAVDDLHAGKLARGVVTIGAS